MSVARSADPRGRSIDLAAVTKLLQPDSLTDSGGVRSWIHSPGFPLVAGTLGCLPLLIVHFQQLWSRPHYQFFPLVLVSVCVLYKLRHSDVEPSPRTERRLVAGTALVCGVILAVLAVLRISPLLCCGAWLMVALSTVFRSQLNLWSAWGLMCLLLRLPQGKDVWLIQTLQRITTGIASTVLDQMRIDHIREGNVLAFPSHKLLVEEACSGVVSLFTIIATAAILGAFLRRSFLHTVLLMIAGAFWAAAANILRVVVIAYAMENLGLDLTQGWEHDALGITIFCVTLVTLFSTDALFRFAFGPIEIDDTGSPEPIHDNWLVILWNHAFWPQHERPGVSPIRTPTNSPSGSGWGFLALLSAMIFSGLGALQAWGGIGPFSTSLKTNLQIDQLSRESLPSELAGWALTDFHIQERRATSEFGERSRQWTYSKDGMRATVSIDYPFPEWHDLDTCYRGVGWRTSRRIPLPGETPHFSNTAVQHALANDLQTGWLIFDMFDQQGHGYTPPLGSGIHPRWRRLMSGDAHPWSLPTYYQVQVLSSRDSLKPYERTRQSALQDLFAAARARILEIAVQPQYQAQPPEAP